MATQSLSFTRHTPAGRAAALISHVYWTQHVQGLTVQEGEKLALGDVTSLVEITNKLSDAAGKTNDALGASDEQRKEAREWLAQVEQGSWNDAQQLKAIDEKLTSKTYAAGSSLTAADLGVFAAVQPYIAEASHSTLLSHPALTRHFDHIQSLPQLSSALSQLFTPAHVQIDVDNVPLVEIKPDVKAKKPKPEAAAAAPAGEGEKPAAAAAAGKQANVAKAISDKKKGEQKGEASAAAVAAEGAKPEGKKKEKAPKEKKPAPPAPVAEAPAPWMVDLRVGKIVDVKVHPDADSLYVEQIDIGEAVPRTVVSGLVKYKTLDEMRNATLIAVCNLKPASMRGVKSFAMVLCATSPDGKDSGVEFVDPPAGSQPGDRVYFEGFQDKTALELLNPKKKIFETVQPGFTTLETREAAWVDKESGKVHKIVTDKGVCKAPNFVGASLS
ncbi:hypothetical protein JCM10908_004704 [Rhodotorula pacifica]|uniref:Arc1p n=1 Tax=Rhodotorula pacifica TaxID=1495444 RepID=UPI003180AAA9